MSSTRAAMRPARRLTAALGRDGERPSGSGRTAAISAASRLFRAAAGLPKKRRAAASAP